MFIIERKWGQWYDEGGNWIKNRDAARVFGSEYEAAEKAGELNVEFGADDCDVVKVDGFANCLRVLRSVAGLTVTDLAESAGLSRQTIYNYENGVGEPTWAVVCKLAECLGVSTESFR
jgi:DNA-binding XRE family transcriptional regulator